MAPSTRTQGNAATSSRASAQQPAPGSSARVSPAQLRQLKSRVNETRKAMVASKRQPTLLKKKGFDEFSPAKEYEFRSEANYGARDQNRVKLPKGHKFVYPRLVNSWFLCASGTHDLVAPEFHAPGDKDDSNVYDLYGVMNPGNDGARRLTRTYSGHTPLNSGSHPDVWQLQTAFLVARVKTPHAGEFRFLGCRLRNVIFPSADRDGAEYVVQNPDKAYAPFFDHTRALWAYRAATGVGEELPEWLDVDVSKPRPWFCNRWAIEMMRLERGLPRHIEGDPERLAMLGECRFARGQGKRAPETEEQWAALESQPGDDEADDSDAGSIVDDVESGVPTSTSWDPVTKKSATPQGKEPHPHPGVVQQLIVRNAAHEAQLPPEGQSQAGSSGLDAQVEEGSVQPLAERATGHIDEPPTMTAGNVGSQDMRVTAPPPSAAPSVAPSTSGTPSASTSSSMPHPRAPQPFFLPQPGAGASRVGPRGGQDVQRRQREQSHEFTPQV